jgi:hypothetical protein
MATTAHHAVASGRGEGGVPGRKPLRRDRWNRGSDCHDVVPAPRLLPAKPSRSWAVTPGTKSAYIDWMRALAALVLLGGCFAAGSGGGGGTRPGVMPMLSELPADSTKRDAVLDSANTTAGPEHRKGQTKKERRAETAAATAAAILGNMFSTTKSVTIGSATEFDENTLIAPHAVQPLVPSSDASADGDAAKPDGKDGKDGKASDAGPSNADLVPWIKLKK